MEFFIIRNGEQTGPFSQDTVKALLNSGSLKPNDLGWCKGLPSWAPLVEIMQPNVETATLPPPVSGLRSGVARRASAKQRALLKYLGLSAEENLAREDAALQISDALESPKLSARMPNWHEERLKLHPDIFQDELDFRRSNRVSRYLELCQTEGAEAVQGVTKAHVQVLIEALDKREPLWERHPRTSLWDYFLPTVAEHFPQLLRSDFRGKLKFGGSPKIGAGYSDNAHSEELENAAAPGAFAAALRGLVYGGLILGFAICGIYWYQNRTSQNAAAVAVKKAPPLPPVVANRPAPNPDDAPLPVAINPSSALLIAANPAPAEIVANASDPAGPGAANATAPAPDSTAPNPPLSAPAPASTTPATAPTQPPAITASAIPTASTVPALPGVPASIFTPAPLPPGLVPAPAAPANPAAFPETPAALAGKPAPVIKTFATLTKTVSVQLQYGRVTLNPGTQVRLLAIEGPNVRVNFNNNVISLPLIATDVDPATMMAPPRTATALTPVAPAPAAPPALPPGPKPSSDL